METQRRSRSVDRVPQYDASLSAFQAAFHPELDQSLDQLPLTKASRILDVPCGNGFYSKLLASRLGPKGRLHAVDLCRNYLARARQRLHAANCSWTVHRSDAYSLPFDEETFDVVWCAQSLISLSAARAIEEMKRVLRPGGTMAILENDVFHHVLLPWPVHLEVPVQRAIQLACRTRLGSDTKLSPVRRLPKLLERAGLTQIQKHTFAADRRAPWSAAVKKFLECHLIDLKRLIRGRLSPMDRAAFRRFVDPDDPESLLGHKAMDLTCLNVLYCATK